MQVKICATSLLVGSSMSGKGNRQWLGDLGLFPFALIILSDNDRCSDFKFKISIMNVRIFVLRKTFSEHLTQFDKHRTDSDEPTA